MGEHELREVNQNAEALKKNFLELTELKHILRKTQQFFDEQEGLELNQGGQHQQLIQDEGGAGGGLQLGFVAGVILRERLPAFEKMLWRACRGNVFLRVAEIEDPLEDPHTGDQVFKSVFVTFFQGEQLKSRVKKICEGFRATLYPCPDQASDRREMAVGVMQRLEDLNTVLGQTNDHRHRVLVAAAKNIKVWFVKVRKIKAIYHTLNYFNLDTSQKCLIAECWIPRLDMEAIQLALRRGTERSGSTVAPILNEMQTTEAPPTFFRTNKFTKGFQALINAYGVASYREANPAVFTIIMFGFALYMVVKEKQLMARKSDNEIWNYFFNGRYIIFLMGIFSIYTGLICNDVFSKSMNIFGSSWQVTEARSTILHHESLMLNPGRNEGNRSDYHGSPYPFGVLMSLWNNKYFGKTVNIIHEFLPQLIFLTCMFGYMALLMLHKWTAFTAGGFDGDVLTTERCAPSILITFINMVLFKPNEPDSPECEAYMYMGQSGIQHLLVLVAVICVPWMLLVKPLINKNKPKVPGEETDFTEVMILQGIHTIEYVLGTVSHTASYLRLWALSLAHAQLSEVLWSMVMRIGLSSEGWVGGVVLWAIFSAWAVLTVGILCLMEGLSAFLHTLRLHWVEFQTKFYGGNGYLFIPFSFETILKQAEDD